MTSRRRQILVLAPVLVVALGASVWVAVATSDRVSQGWDSASYLGAAAAVRSGHAPAVPFTDIWDTYAPHTAVRFAGRVPSTHFPPGYAITLAAVSRATGHLGGAVRWLDVLLVFLNLALIGLLAARLTSYRSIVAAVVPPALLLFVPDTGRAGLMPLPPHSSQSWTQTVPNLGVHLGWLNLHLGAYCEPLFMALSAGAVLAIGTAVGQPDLATRRARWSTLMAAVLASGALLTRYAGLAVVATVVLALLFLGRSQRRRLRLAVAAFVGLVAVVPTALFLARSALLGGGNARILSYHSAPQDDLVNTVGRFFLPASWPTWTFLVVAMVIAVAMVLAAVASPGRRPDARPKIAVRPTRWQGAGRPLILFRVALIFVASYLIVVFATRALLDVETPVDARLLSPVRGIVYTLVIALIYQLASRYAHAGVALAVVAGLCLGLVAADWSTEQNVLDYGAGPKVVESPVDVRLASLPAGALIVSNVAAVVYLISGRTSYNLPQRVVYVTGRPNPDFGRDMAAWGKILDARGGYAFFLSPGIKASAHPADLRARGHHATRRALRHRVPVQGCPVPQLKRRQRILLDTNPRHH